MQKKLTEEAMFSKALELVESESIRAWAQTEHNRPLWLKIASTFKDAETLAAYVVCTAIGL